MGITIMGITTMEIASPHWERHVRPQSGLVADWLKPWAGARMGTGRGVLRPMLRLHRTAKIVVVDG